MGIYLFQLGGFKNWKQRKEQWENLRQKSIKLFSFFMKAAYGLKHKEAFKIFNIVSNKELFKFVMLQLVFKHVFIVP